MPEDQIVTVRLCGGPLSGELHKVRRSEQYIYAILHDPVSLTSSDGTQPTYEDAQSQIRYKVVGELAFYAGLEANWAPKDELPVLYRIDRKLYEAGAMFDEAEAIYLGRKEFAVLKHMMEDECRFRCVSDGRRRYKGIPVIEVMEVSHIGIAMKRK